jgi:hypothetical protein
MLSLGLLKGVVDILIKLIFYAVDVLFVQKFGVHHRWSPPLWSFLLLDFLRVARGVPRSL